MSKTLKKLLSLLLALSMISSFAATAWAADGTGNGTELKLTQIDPASLHVEREGLVNDGEEPAEPAPVHALTDMVRVSILLEEPAALDAGFSVQGVGTNGAAVSYRNALKANQDAVAQRISETVLEGEPLRVKWNLTLAANIISAEVPYGRIGQIREVSGVEDVVLENRYAPAEAEKDDGGSAAYPNMTGARDMTGSNGTYSSQYTGAGRRLAVIDTGLDTDHQSFNADAFQYAVNETGASGQLLTQAQVNSLKSSLNGKNGVYLSAKIPFAYNYIDNNTTVNHSSDQQGEHGSHVAGITSANRYLKSGSSYVSAAEQVGVVGQAPDAQIMVMKVFGSGGGAYDSDYMAAIEDAIVLGADAANLSLGSALPGITTVTSTYQSIMSGLVSKGMVVSISMGNNTSWDSQKQLYADDINLHTGGSPGSYANALTVASVDDSGTVAPYLLFNDQLELRYMEGGGSASNAPMTSVAGTYSYIYLDAVGTSTQFNNLKSQVNGKIALCNRGETSFYEKANAAMAAGAVALIIVNNQAGTIAMALDGYTYTKPVVSIKQSEGEAIKAISQSRTSSGVTYYTGTIKVGGAGDLTPMAFYEMSSFSSWGVPGSLILKPEITAPGGSVKSLNGYHRSESGSGYEGGHDAYELMSGTSMAAPQITGISAVIGEYYSRNGIQTRTGLSLRKFAQSILMSTATPILESESGSYYSLLKQGAGLANVDAAVSARTYILMNEDATASWADGKVKAELGDRPERDGVYSFSFTVNNLTDQNVTFEAPVTDLFTQALENGGANLSHLTQPLGASNEGVSYAWVVGESPVESHDVNRDGVTSEADAQAILDCLTGKTAASALDLAAGEMDGDGTITTQDAQLLLNWTPSSGGVSGYVVPANGQASVTVSIRLTAAQLAILNDEHRDAAYVEAFVKLTEKNGVTHSIPVLGFHGSWTDPSMFDAVRYEENYLGTTQSSYFSASNTNGLQIRQGTTTSWVTGNPYVKETPFPADRLAVNTGATIYQARYNLIRPGAIAAGITKADGTVLYSGSPSFNQNAAYFNTQLTTPAWQNTSTSTASISQSVSSLGLKEGDVFTAGLYAVPEYYAYQANGSDRSSTVSSAQFKSLLSSGKLGKGAYIGYTFTVDNTAPAFQGAQVSDNKLTVTVKDNRYVACVKLMNSSGSTTYASAVPEQNNPGEAASYTFDLSGLNTGNTVTLFAGDYAGNETAMLTTLDGGSAVVERTVYVLTSTLTAGEDYLIVSGNTAGSAYALGHSGATSARDAVAVKAADDASAAPYIDGADADSTSVWTVSGSYKFQNGSYYLRRSNNNTLSISTTNSNNEWGWDSASNRLSINGRYLRYSGSSFSLSTTAGSVYLFQKTTVTEELDPGKVDSVTVTPASASLYNGTTLQLNAEVLPLTASDKSVTWTSSDPAVVTVDGSGLVTAVGAGTATVTAASSAMPDVKGTASITVKANTLMPGATVNAQLVEDGTANFVRIDLGSLSVENLGQAAGIHFGGGRSDDVIIGFQSDGNIVETDIEDGSYDSYILGSFNTTDYNSRDGAHLPGLSGTADGVTLDEQYISVFVAASNLMVFTPSYTITGWSASGYTALTYIGTDTEAGQHYFYALNSSGGLVPMAIGVDGDEPIVTDEEKGTTSLNLTLGTGSAVSVSGLTVNATAMSMSLLDTDDYYGLLIANNSTREIYFVDLTQNTYKAVLVGGLTSASGITTLYNDNYDVSVVPMPANSVTDLIKESVRNGETVKAQHLDGLLPAGQQTAGSLNAFRGEYEAQPAAASTVNAPDAAAGGQPGSADVTITEAGAVNGLYTVAYDANQLTFSGSDTDLTYVSVNETAPGTVKVAFASKTAIGSGDRVAVLHFTAKTCGDAEVTVVTNEKGGSFGLGDSETVTIAGTGHSWGEWTVTTEPTCTEKGEETRTCKLCGETETREVEALGHDLVKTEAKAATCTEAGNSEYYTCRRCGEFFSDSEGKNEIAEGSWVIAALGHDWGEWTVTKAATCTEKGEETRTCRRCGEKESREIEPTGHTLEKTEAKAATCTEAGNSEYYTCKVCGKYYSDSEGRNEVTEGSWVIAALGHNWGEWTITKAATCEEKGEETRTCGRCGEKETRETEALGHDLVKTEAKAATCTEAGNSEYYTCGRCGKYFSDAEGRNEISEGSWVIAALGHNGGEWTVTKAATCEEKGEETRTCARCGEKETREIEALGHDLEKTEAKAATCTEAGNSEYYTCKACGKFFSDAEGKNEIVEGSWVTEALGHDWGEPKWSWTEDYSATAEFTCKRDPAHTETVSADVTSKTDPDGTVTYTATVVFNGKTYTDTLVLAPDGHRIIVEDYTAGNARTSLKENQLYSGEVTFTVTADAACLIVLKNPDGTCTVLKTEGEEHTCTVRVTDSDVTLAVAFLGDANLDGKVSAKDATLVKQVYLELTTFKADAGLQALLADVNRDGELSTKDATLIKQAILGTAVLAW